MAYAVLPSALGLDLKTEALKACKSASDNEIAKAMCDCAKDLKADREHFKKCAQAAAAIAAGGYCAAQTGSPTAGAICANIASYIAGPVAGAVYDAGDALVTGISDLFGGSDKECPCASCFWGKCWSELSEAQKLRFCTMPEHLKDWQGHPNSECPAVIARESATRLDAVTRVNAAYGLWVRGMVKALNDKLLPQLIQLGKPTAPFTPAYVEALVARHPVSPQDVGFETPAPQPAWWFQKAPATKPGYGWFRGTTWDAPINIVGITSDPYAVARADLWARQLLAIEPLVFSDILMQIAQAVRSVDRKHLHDFTIARQQAQQKAAMLGTTLLLTGAAVAGILIWRNRRK